MRERIKYLGIKVDCRGDMSEFVEEKIKMSKRNGLSLIHI